ncbi:hypothetical protein XENOCAPTIV_017151, partial [Xenoophorus captivus]
SVLSVPREEWWREKILVLGILKATEFRDRCLQLTVLLNDVYGSEDLATNLPVMVWIFGGGFLVGASFGANFLENYLYSGQEIADRGNVIVVTLGYRVALKVNCPTDQNMAKCLKMTDPKALTLAGTLKMSGSPDGNLHTYFRLHVERFCQVLG